MAGGCGAACHPVPLHCIRCIRFTSHEQREIARVQRKAMETGAASCFILKFDNRHEVQSH
jgi:hypothetical protein